MGTYDPFPDLESLCKAAGVEPGDVDAYTTDELLRRAQGRRMPRSPDGQRVFITRAISVPIEVTAKVDAHMRARGLTLNRYLLTCLLRYAQEHVGIEDAMKYVTHGKPADV